MTAPGVFSTPLDLEAAWLGAVDDLPTLQVANGGPFQIVQARWPRIPATTKSGIYVSRQAAASFRIARFSSQRTIPSTAFLLKLIWPFTSTGTGSAEAAQLAFDQAIDLVVQRVMGPLGDKTHGGRFLSVAETGEGITVSYPDPEEAIPNGVLRAAIAYMADAFEINN